MTTDRSRENSPYADGGMAENFRPVGDLDDVRRQLPAPFRDAPDHDIPGLWLACGAARRGHTQAYLITHFGLSTDTAERAIAMARNEDHGSPSTTAG